MTRTVWKFYKLCTIEDLPFPHQSQLAHTISERRLDPSLQRDNTLAIPSPEVCSEARVVYGSTGMVQAMEIWQNIGNNIHWRRSKRLPGNVKQIPEDYTKKNNILPKARKNWAIQRPMATKRRVSIADDDQFHYFAEGKETALENHNKIGNQKFTNKQFKGSYKMPTEYPPSSSPSKRQCHLKKYNRIASDSEIPRSSKLK